MNEQKDFMPPAVESEFDLSKIWKRIKSARKIIWHGLTPHGSAKEPAQAFKSIHITHSETLFTTAQEFYKETNSRIDALEEKSFKLITYISAVSVLLVYFLGTDAKGYFKLSIIFALFLLTVAILISLRCIGIKSRKAMYIDSIFEFNADLTIAPKSSSQEEIIASLINCAVFNQNVGDNTADILKASRIFLSMGILTTLISCCFYIGSSYKMQDDKIYKATIMFKDTTLMPIIKNHFQKLDSDLKMVVMPPAHIKPKNTPADSIKKN